MSILKYNIKNLFIKKINKLVISNIIKLLTNIFPRKKIQIYNYKTRLLFHNYKTKRIKNKFYLKENFQSITRNSYLSWVLSSLTRFYVPLAIGFLIISPVEFLFFNSVTLCILGYYKKIDLLKLLIINILLCILWVFFVCCYMHVLTNDPFFPLNCGDRVDLTPENLFLVVCYCTQVESIFRATFVETLILVFMLSRLFNSEFTLFFFV